MKKADLQRRRKGTQRSFSERVLSVVREIPRGRTLSYSEVARRAGRPRGARAVGNILHRNYDFAIPCHRVIRTGGKLGGYNNGAPLKREKLASEGVSV